MLRFRRGGGSNRAPCQRQQQLNLLLPILNFLPGVSISLWGVSTRGKLNTAAGHVQGGTLHPSTAVTGDAHLLGAVHGRALLLFRKFRRVRIVRLRPVAQLCAHPLGESLIRFPAPHGGPIQRVERPQGRQHAPLLGVLIRPSGRGEQALHNLRAHPRTRRTLMRRNFHQLLTGEHELGIGGFTL